MQHSYKTLEESIYLQQEILLTTLNAMGAIVYVIDIETDEILFANESCKKTFGNIVGRQCYTVLHSATQRFTGWTEDALFALWIEYKKILAPQ